MRYDNMEPDFDDEELDYHPNGRRKNMKEMPEYHPTIWTRANNEKIHVKDMNQHHLTNAIKYLEKSLGGYGEKPAIYFNMLKRLNEIGGGITADQIKALLDKATTRKPISMVIYNPNLSSLSRSQYDLILSLEDDGDAISLVVVDEEGDQATPLASVRRNGALVAYQPGPELPLDPWLAPVPAAE